MTAEGQTITVMLPKIARKTIGLADGSFSRISIRYHSLVFEGQGVTQPVQLPVTMLGTFHNDMLNNLFLYLRSIRQNGILAITTGPLTKAVFFKRGRIVFAGTTDARERIGNILLSHGFMTEEEIQLIEEHEDPRRFGVRCKEAGFITYDELWEALRIQLVQVCCSLVDFPVGTYFFLPNAVPGDAFSHFNFEPSQLLFEGVVRLDERQRAIGDDGTLDGRSPLDVLAAMEDD